MRKRGKALLACLLAGVMMSSITVGATTISGNEVDEANSGQEEIVWELTEEEMTVEMSAVLGEGRELQTEASGKKYLFLGDSVACGYHDMAGNYIHPFIYYFSQVNDAIITNKAVGGATYSTTNDRNVMTQLKEVKLSDYDAVFMDFGVNDFSTSRAIGSSTDTNTQTVCGALNAAITQCKKAGIKCYVILPFPCQKQFQNKTNINGYYYPAYVAAIKSVCEKQGIEMIDFYTQFGINKDNYGAFYIDSVHPNNELQKNAGLYLNEYLKKAEQKPVAVNDIAQFIERLYNNCLSRTADYDGAQYWYGKLSTRAYSGAAAAQGFFFSEEFENHGYSNEEYVELLYNTMMDRKSDEAGLKYWVDMLDNGISRLCVFKGFTESQEFTNICESYGIERGSIGVSEGRDYNPGLTLFISRLYTKALGRDYDVDGLNYWCSQVVTGKIDITKMSTVGFFHSQEFKNKNLSDGEYIKVLYRTFLGREYDEAGYQYWINQLRSGKTRDEVLYGFAYSKEFSQIKASYGLK